MNVLVTAGGTIAPIDDVRAIANASTGRFGAMIAEAALRRGARASGTSTPPEPSGRSTAWRSFDLETPDLSAEFQRLGRLREEWSEVRDRCHAVPLSEGTVAEYAERLGNASCVTRKSTSPSWRWRRPTSPRSRFSGKLSSDASTLVLRCQRLPKVIQSVRDWSPSVHLVGFKLLSDAPEAELIRQAEAACLENRADLTVANDLSTVRAGRHTIHLVRPGHPTETIGPDRSIAEELVDRVFAWAKAQGH